MRIGESPRPAPPSEASAPARPPPAPTTSTTRGGEDDGPSPFARILHGLGTEVDRGERMVRRAVAGGGELGPTELLALQAGVYRYSEAVDLSAKLVDRATSGVKTVIQGQ